MSTPPDTLATKLLIAGASSRHYFRDEPVAVQPEPAPTPLPTRLVEALRRFSRSLQVDEVRGSVSRAH